MRRDGERLACLVVIGKNKQRFKLETDGLRKIRSRTRLWQQQREEIKMAMQKTIMEAPIYKELLENISFFPSERFRNLLNSAF
jgi:hypothetical protein